MRGVNILSDIFPSGLILLDHLLLCCQANSRFGTDQADRSLIKVSFVELAQIARHLAAVAPQSGDWLLSLPIANWLRLNNEAVRIAVGMSLGVCLCVPHKCHCGAKVDTQACHAERHRAELPGIMLWTILSGEPSTLPVFHPRKSRQVYADRTANDQTGFHWSGGKMVSLWFGMSRLWVHWPIRTSLWLQDSLVTEQAAACWEEISQIHWPSAEPRLPADSCWEPGCSEHFSHGISERAWPPHFHLCLVKTENRHFFLAHFCQHSTLQ